MFCNDESNATEESKAMRSKCHGPTDFSENGPVGNLSRKKKRRGFNLIELMVVVVIIGMLAGVVTFNVRGYLIRSKQNVTRMDIAKVCQALETFYTAHDRYPTNDEGVQILLEKTSKFPEAVLERLPRDPWGRPYQYNHPGRDAPYEVVSFGADGREGGDSGDTDISSVHLQEESD